MKSVEEALVAGDKVQLVGFGTFETRERAARQGRNPRNPEEVIEIPASKAPVFKAGKGVKRYNKRIIKMKKCGSIYHTFSVYKGGVFTRLDKFLKVSRIIKRRTVAKEACDKGIVTINGKVAKSSSEVNIGDLLEIQFGEKEDEV